MNANLTGRIRWRQIGTNPRRLQQQFFTKQRPTGNVWDAPPAPVMEWRNVPMIST